MPKSGYILQSQKKRENTPKKNTHYRTLLKYEKTVKASQDFHNKKKKKKSEKIGLNLSMSTCYNPIYIYIHTHTHKAKHYTIQRLRLWSSSTLLKYKK